MSRASFPVLLIDQLSSEAHNGIATFLFDDERVSMLRFQITQETAPWVKYDYWGHAPMTFLPGAIPGESDLRAQFIAERQHQLMIRPWSALPTSASSTVLAGFDGALSPEDVSASGMVVDGILYLRGCNTRTGPFPFCREMRHSVYSVTKSMGAAVALLRLAQKYCDEVLNLKIADYVSVTSAHDGWKHVTLADALNMATGIGDKSPLRQPNDPEADELGPKHKQFDKARTAKEKLDVSFSYGKYPWEPGEIVRYNSTQTFVLAAAMDAYLKRREGPNAHIWGMLVDEVFRPIGILHAPTLHTLETDGSRGVPLLSTGLFPTIEDVAKLATLLQSGGRHDGQQLLSPAKLAEALFRANVMTGIATGRGNRFGGERYHLGFWSIAYQPRNGCTVHIPYMSGHGGNLVVLLPNAVSAIRFADALSYDKESLVLASEAIRPLCPVASDATPSPSNRVALGADEVRAELVGNTLHGRLRNTFIDPAGTVYAVSRLNPIDVDVGRWKLNAEGQFCVTWNVSDHGRSRCNVVYRDTNRFEFQPVDQWGSVTAVRVLGNPDGR